MASSISAQGREPTIIKTLPADNKSVTTCKTTSDHLVVAKEGALYTFNFADHSLNTLQERGNTIWSLASRDDDDHLLVAGGTEGELRLWDVKAKAVTRSLKGHTETVRSLQIVNGTTLISGSRDSTIRIWDLGSDSNDSTLTLTGHTATVKCLRVHDNIFVSGSYDSDARIWDLRTGECLHVLKGHTGPLYDVCFDGSQVITASLDTDIRVWDPQSGACRAVLSGHTGLVGQLSLQGNTLVSGDNLGTVKVWSLDAPGSGQVIAQEEKENPVISLAFDAGNIIFGNASGSVHLVRRDLGASEALLTGVDNVWCVGFTPSKRPWVVYVKGEDTQLGIL